MKMIDFLKLRTYSQKEIIKLRELDLLPDFPKKGRECYKLNDRIKYEFRPVFETDEFLGYAYVDIILYPHFLFNGGAHNGNDLSPSDCMNVLDEVFKLHKIEENNLKEYQVVNIEFGINVIPETDVKEVVQAIKCWKRKLYIRNKADFSLITNSTAHKQIKAYAKGIDDLERLKSGEVHPNTFRFEIKSKERKFLNLTAKDLFREGIYKDFQERLLTDLDLTLFVENPKAKNGLSKKEKIELKILSNPDKWDSFLNDKNRDKFNYQRKKYEKICAKIPTIKREIKKKIEGKLCEWQNSAFSTKKKLQTKEHKKLIINELN